MAADMSPKAWYGSLKQGIFPGDGKVSNESSDHEEMNIQKHLP